MGYRIEKYFSIQGTRCLTVMQLMKCMQKQKIQPEHSPAAWIHEWLKRARVIKVCCGKVIIDCGDFFYLPKVLVFVVHLLKINVL